MTRQKLTNAIYKSYGILPSDLKSRTTEQIWSGLTDRQRKTVEKHL